MIGKRQNILRKAHFLKQDYLRNNVLKSNNRNDFRLLIQWYINMRVCLCQFSMFLCRTSISYRAAALLTSIMI